MPIACSYGSIFEVPSSQISLVCVKLIKWSKIGLFHFIYNVLKVHSCCSMYPNLKILCNTEWNKILPIVHWPTFKLYSPFDWVFFFLGELISLLGLLTEHGWGATNRREPCHPCLDNRLLIARWIEPNPLLLTSRVVASLASPETMRQLGQNYKEMPGK